MAGSLYHQAPPWSYRRPYRYRSYVIHRRVSSRTWPSVYRSPVSNFSVNNILTASILFFVVFLTVDFNKLGLTDNENPYGVIEPLLARNFGSTFGRNFGRSFGRKAGTLLVDYVTNFMTHHRDRRRRRKRQVDETPPILPERHRNAFHGGERAILYVMIEELLDNFGIDGKACLLRAICEIHSYSLTSYGLIGEMLKLFFTASRSPYAHLLQEYVDAEMAGKGNGGGPSECWPYLKDCPKSLFQNNHNLYRLDGARFCFFFLFCSSFVFLVRTRKTTKY